MRPETRSPGLPGRPRLTGVATLAVLLAIGGCAQSDPVAEGAAFEATKPWLAIMDAGDYERCWVEASPLFRDQESQDGWAAKAKGYRDPLGGLKSRQLNVTRVIRDPWGAPAGLYAAVVYDSHWDNGVIYETVNMQQQSDGRWLVAGYQVKQQ